MNCTTAWHIGHIPPIWAASAAQEHRWPQGTQAWVRVRSRHMMHSAPPSSWWSYGSSTTGPPSTIPIVYIVRLTISTLVVDNLSYGFSLRFISHEHTRSSLIFLFSGREAYCQTLMRKDAQLVEKERASRRMVERWFRTIANDYWTERATN